MVIVQYKILPLQTDMMLIFEHHQIHIINLGDQIRLFTELPDFLIGD